MRPELGFDVVVAAAHREGSGASASLSALEDDGRLLTRTARLDALPEVRALAVEASPAARRAGRLRARLAPTRGRGELSSFVLVVNGAGAGGSSA